MYFFKIDFLLLDQTIKFFFVTFHVIYNIELFISIYIFYTQFRTIFVVAIFTFTVVIFYMGEFQNNMQINFSSQFEGLFLI